MKTSILDYELPKELIAQEPCEPRDHARLMVVDRKKGTIVHDLFYNLHRYVKDSLIVFNDSKVFPARMEGRLDTGGKAEVLLLRKAGEGIWITLAKPGRKFKTGRRVFFEGGVEGVVAGRSDGGQKIIEFFKEGKPASDEDLKKAGKIPLPPYIKKTEISEDSYQTVYACEEGSVAAPTAGLHFTTELIEKMKQAGNEVVFITLHVGTFTFKPIETEKIEQHEIGEEIYEISDYEAKVINEAIEKSMKVVAVGTTTVRALESAFEDGKILSGRKTTRLFIYPGYRFKVVDAMITNFHLPRTTLLALVYAFGGIELMRKAYEEAVREKYRFYSFGDGMLIL